MKITPTPHTPYTHTAELIIPIKNLLSGSTSTESLKFSRPGSTFNQTFAIKQNTTRD